jgi:hypothetical protein
LGYFGTRVQFPPPPFDSLRSLMAGQAPKIKEMFSGQGLISSKASSESNALSKRSASKGFQVKRIRAADSSIPPPSGSLFASIFCLYRPMRRRQSVRRSHLKRCSPRKSSLRQSRSPLDLLPPPRHAGLSRTTRFRRRRYRPGTSNQVLDAR